MANLGNLVTSIRCYDLDLSLRNDFYDFANFALRCRTSAKILIEEGTTIAAYVAKTMTSVRTNEILGVCILCHCMVYLSSLTIVKKSF